MGLSTKTIAVLSIVALCATAPSAEDAKIWDVTISLNAGGSEFALHEPIPLKISWKNRTTSDQNIERSSPMLAIKMDGEWRNIGLFITSKELWQQQLADVGIAPVIVKPNESYDEMHWLLLGAFSDSPAWKFLDSPVWKFLIDKEGDWTVSWQSDHSKSVAFRIKKPGPSDEKAFALFSKDEAASLLGEDAGPASAMENLITIAKDYPESVYAPYATLALGNHRQKSTAKDKRLEGIDAWLKKVIEHHSRGFLGECALELAIRVAVGEGDFIKAIQFYKKLKIDHPDSTFIQMYRALENASPVKVKLKTPEEMEVLRKRYEEQLKATQK